MKNKIFPAIALTVALLPLPVGAQIASGGVYRLEQSVVASGGGTSDGGSYKIEGTNGQAAAGAVLTNAPYRLAGGFWTPLQLAPTAAGVSIGGRVVDTGGQGLRGAIVVLTGGSLTAPRIARTNNFGAFILTGVESGHFYVISVQHKKYGFAQDSQTLMLLEDRDDLVFRADWEN